MKNKKDTVDFKEVVKAAEEYRTNVYKIESLLCTDDEKNNFTDHAYNILKEKCPEIKTIRVVVGDSDKDYFIMDDDFKYYLK